MCLLTAFSYQRGRWEGKCLEKRLSQASVHSTQKRDLRQTEMQRGNYSIKTEIFTARTAKHRDRLSKAAVETHPQRHSTTLHSLARPDATAEIAPL